MTRSVGLAHIMRQPDGSAMGVWGVHVLRSAFQPIFAFNGGKLAIAAFEGLIRPSRDGNPVSPGAFFASVPAVDRMHVETLSRTLHLLNAGTFLDKRAQIFVNFDPSVFVDHATTDMILRDMRLVLHEADVQADRIVCEVTEQKCSSDAMLFDFVRTLRASGFKIAVDDYGSDDSDIGRIERLRPDIVKFDAHWITHLMKTGPGFALLSEMVATFAARGIRTVFEGIEHPWQLELAERTGASMVQGYVVARPQLVPPAFDAFPYLDPAVPTATAFQAPTRPPLEAAPPIAAPPRAARPVFGKRGDAAIR